MLMSSIRKASQWGKLFLYERGLRGYVYEPLRMEKSGNILTKTCRGKVMKEKLKNVKVDSSFFTLHSSFCESSALAPRKVSFDCAKDHVSSPQTSPFTQRNMVFRTAKPKLSQIRILQTARLQKQIRVIIYQSTLYEKHQKSPSFRPKIFLFEKKGLIWG